MLCLPIDFHNNIYLKYICKLYSRNNYWNNSLNSNCYGYYSSKEGIHIVKDEMDVYSQGKY